MIDFLRGSVVHIEPEYAVIDVGGVGYRVFCANPYALQNGSGGETTVYVHHHVREDAIQLFGFATRSEQALFRLLLEVSGIGPKVALAALAGAGSPERVMLAIGQEDVAFLTKLPGIGKKTAQRMILDLKDKLGKALPAGLAMSGEDWLAAQTPAAGGTACPGDGGPWAEVREALISLGYTGAEADRAYARIKDTMQPSDDVEAWMKRALQALYKG
ncbi:Holliday junction branch migration protein RuvA [Paenibacillus thermoaerophilus]|uniref:Holliday junction branch migration complex subunit RuvA n=1 Tax=Paenibacillus thermoaerophilus TaxID=1215385 RepID=A0ABW2V0Z2_9BACL|nr:Holliday junction branch migration protein RuvA [Paenibacillus thermoaerophilus]TMV17305.1 Holliday junction branch migration protein RuvA [Paenibacillus thermoaerophilus]